MEKKYSSLVPIQARLNSQIKRSPSKISKGGRDRDREGGEGMQLSPQPARIA